MKENVALKKQLKDLMIVNAKLSVDNKNLTSDKAKLSTISCALVEQIESVLDVFEQIASDNDANVQIDEYEEDEENQAWSKKNKKSAELGITTKVATSKKKVQGKYKLSN